MLLLLLLAFTPPPEHTVQVIFAEPPGEQLTAVEQADAYAVTTAVMSWWCDLSPITTTLTMSGTMTVSTTSEMFEYPTSINLTPDTITVIVVDNTVSGSTFGGRLAVATFALHTIWITSRTLDAARLAHEFGHALYGLPDWYLTTKPSPVLDIMDWSYWQAYTSRVIGCRSRAFLGAPCRMLYLPLTGTPSQHQRYGDAV